MVIHVHVVNCNFILTDIRNWLFLCILSATIVNNWLRHSSQCLTTHNHGTSNQSYQPGSYCFFIVLLELKIFKNKQHNKKTIWPSISYFWAFSFICMQTSGKKNQFKYNSKIFFSFPKCTKQKYIKKKPNLELMNNWSI